MILDNCTHKKCDDGLAQYPNVHFRFTPTSVSWLHQVEIWFGIMSRKALRGAGLRSVAELSQAINAFIAAYKPNAKPFQWHKPRSKGLNYEILSLIYATNHSASAICQIIGAKPASARCASIFEKQRQPIKNRADSGDGWPHSTTR